MDYRLVALEIVGFRTLQNVRLELPRDRPAVVIGENGSGKSTILEALEILRRAAVPGVVHEVSTRHGGLSSLVRQGEQFLRLRIEAESTDGDGTIVYDVSFYLVAGRAVLLYEFLTVMGEAEHIRVIDRRVGGAKVLELFRGPVDFPFADDDSVLATFRAPNAHWGIDTMRSLLAGIDVHPALTVIPVWAADRGGAGLREPVVFAPIDRLDPLGTNLPNAIHYLMNEFGEAHRQETLDLVRLGLGMHVEAVATRPDAGGGRHALTVKYRGLDRPVPAHDLSDGTLVYLALVAAVRLGSRRSLLAFDEPDLHLHPAAVTRIVSALEALSEQVPVVVATQSDVVLDCLEHPAESAVLCQLDPEMRTVLVRPDPAQLARWLEDYRGLGHLRAEGYEKVVMSRSVVPPDPAP